MYTGRKVFRLWSWGTKSTSNRSFRCQKNEYLKSSANWRRHRRTNTTSTLRSKYPRVRPRTLPPPSTTASNLLNGLADDIFWRISKSLKTFISKIYWMKTFDVSHASSWSPWQLIFCGSSFEALCGKNVKWLWSEHLFCGSSNRVYFVGTAWNCVDHCTC